eukprot:m.9418 g.9418  ORF g.9418 m.9418 type:complete len:413 (+) comp21343_c0_seq2:21-1259(+)
MHIAVEGCCHGELDKIYATIELIEQKHKIKVDLLLCCGDFQSVRNPKDLESMAVPPKYRQMQSFHKYYTGEKTAPVLTLFVGGNHEASDYLWELPLGGWVAPNIFYLGRSGVVNFKGLRIGGISGIFKSHDYHKGHFEFPPFDQKTMRSVYHIREYEVFKCKLISKPIDIFFSHDWPRGIYHHGDLDQLLRAKPFFREDISTNSLGAPPLEELLNILKPSYWFSGHLHVKFAAVVKHSDSQTKFLALDKCIPGKDFLSILNFPDSDEPAELRYDLEWLAIVSSKHCLMSTDYWQPPLPVLGTGDILKRHQATSDVMKRIEDALGGLKIPESFAPNAAPPVPGNGSANLQTVELCRKLGMVIPSGSLVSAAASEGEPNPDEIAIDCGDDLEEETDEDVDEPPVKQSRDDDDSS